MGTPTITAVDSDDDARTGPTNGTGSVPEQPAPWTYPPIGEHNDAAHETGAAFIAATAVEEPASNTSTPGKPRRNWPLTVGAATIITAAALGAGIIIGLAAQPDPPLPQARYDTLRSIGEHICGTSQVRVEPLEQWAAGSTDFLDVTCETGDTNDPTAALDAKNVHVIELRDLDGTRGGAEWIATGLADDHLISAIGFTNGTTRITVGGELPGADTAVTDSSNTSTTGPSTTDGTAGGG